VTALRPDSPRHAFRFPKQLSPLQSVETGCGTHRGSKSVDTGETSSRGKAAGREGDQPVHSTDEDDECRSTCILDGFRNKFGRMH
jgi:hypothetical protein